MKRRNFFKNLGIGIGALVVAPKVLAEVVNEEPKNVFDVEAIKEQQEYIKNNPIIIKDKWQAYGNFRNERWKKSLTEANLAWENFHFDAKGLLETHKDSTLDQFLSGQFNNSD